MLHVPSICVYSYLNTHTRICTSVRVTRKDLTGMCPKRLVASNLSARRRHDRMQCSDEMHLIRCISIYMICMNSPVAGECAQCKMEGAASSNTMGSLNLCRLFSFIGNPVLCRLPGRLSTKVVFSKVSWRSRHFRRAAFRYPIGLRRAVFPAQDRYCSFSALALDVFNCLVPSVSGTICVWVLHHQHLAPSVPCTVCVSASCTIYALYL